MVSVAKSVLPSISECYHVDAEKPSPMSLENLRAGQLNYGVNPMMTETRQPAIADTDSEMLDPVPQPLIDLRERPSPEILRVLAIGSPR